MDIDVVVALGTDRADEIGAVYDCICSEDVVGVVCLLLLTALLVPSEPVDEAGAAGAEPDDPDDLSWVNAELLFVCVFLAVKKS